MNKGIKPILPTPTECKQITEGNRALINKYYLANYAFIAMVCKSYVYSKELPNKDIAQDMAQECYLYFNKFDLSSPYSFARNIKDICVYVRYGGEAQFHAYRQGNTEVLQTLDVPLPTGKADDGGQLATQGETIPSSFDVIEAIEPEPDFTDTVYNLVKGMLTPRQVEAFTYFYYTDLTAREVGAEMGININGAQSLKTAYIYRLRKMLPELLQRLEAVGYDVSRYATITSI